MRPDETSPYSGKTNEELTAISEWLGRHLQDLRSEHASIQAELQTRGLGPPPVPCLPITPATGLDSPTLDYRTAEALPPSPAVVGDSYADEARHYAMRVTLIAFVVSIVLGLIFCFMAVF